MTPSLSATALEERLQGRNGSCNNCLVSQDIRKEKKNDMQNGRWKEEKGAGQMKNTRVLVSDLCEIMLLKQIKAMTACLSTLKEIIPVITIRP